jgi:hypothetical protein
MLRKDVRADYPHADPLGTCVVFNVSGNKYRLITRIFYATRELRGNVYVLHILTHKEYDSDEDLEPATAVSFELDTRRGVLSPDERDYHEVLINLIVHYEEEHHPIPDVSGPDMLRCLIQNRGLAQAASDGDLICSQGLFRIDWCRRVVRRRTVVLNPGGPEPCPDSSNPFAR